jgi:hypothetical protein
VTEEEEIFPDDPWRRIMAYRVINQLGERVQHLDVKGIVNEIVERLGFVDIPDEIDPAVFEEIVDRHRKSL